VRGREGVCERETVKVGVCQYAGGSQFESWRWEERKRKREKDKVCVCVCVSER